MPVFSEERVVDLLTKDAYARNLGVEVSRGRTLGTYRAEVTREDRVAGLFTGTVFIS